MADSSTVGSPVLCAAVSMMARQLSLGRLLLYRAASRAGNLHPIPSLLLCAPNRRHHQVRVH